MSDSVELGALSPALNEEQLAAVRRMADLLGEMEDNGQLERLLDLTVMVRGLLDAMTTEIVQSLMGTVVQLLSLLDSVMRSEAFIQLPEMLDDLDEVLQDPPRHSERGELRRLWGALRDPDVQDGLELVLEVLRRAGRGARGSRLRSA